MLPLAVLFAAAASAHPTTLAVSPARTVFRAPSSRTLQVSNLSSEDVAVSVAWKALGRPGTPHRWLRIAPGKLVLRGGARGFLTIRADKGASPGDHDVLVLVTGTPTDRSRIAVRLRIGVRVRIRAPGRLRRNVAVDSLRVGGSKRGRALLVSLTNRGNVTEQLGGRVTVTLFRRKRLVSRLRLGRLRELYPATRATAALPYSGRARGFVTALVTVRLAPDVRPVERRYRLLL